MPGAGVFGSSCILVLVLILLLISYVLARYLCLVRPEASKGRRPRPPRCWQMIALRIWCLFNSEGSIQKCTVLEMRSKMAGRADPGRAEMKDVNQSMSICHVFRCGNIVTILEPNIPMSSVALEQDFCHPRAPIPHSCSNSPSSSPRLSSMDSASSCTCRSDSFGFLKAKAKRIIGTQTKTAVVHKSRCTWR